MISNIKVNALDITGALSSVEIGERNSVRSLEEVMKIGGKIDIG